MTKKKQLRRELLAADLELHGASRDTGRRRATSPSSLASSAAILTAAIGFWLGREAAPPPAPPCQPHLPTEISG